jgi:hypothetical protein
MAVFKFAHCYFHVAQRGTYRQARVGPFVTEEAPESTDPHVTARVDVWSTVPKVDV